MDKTVYADYAATTPVCERALEAMLSTYRETYGNPSAIHGQGRKARKAVEGARASVAKSLGGQPNEIYFTASGTESDNWAIKSAAALCAMNGKKRLVTTAIEHPAVLRSFESLQKQGFEVTVVGVEADGTVRSEEIQRSIKPDTGLVSVMYANNEIGMLQPIREIAELCHERGVLFHTDAIQAVGQIAVDVSVDQPDLLSFSAHKFYGPKGVGGLFIRSGVPLPAFLHGGLQERRKRAGTENVAQIVGLAAALETKLADLEERNVKLTKLRELLIKRVLAFSNVSLLGARTNRLPGIASFCFAEAESESLILLLDMAGVYASGGSACASGEAQSSHVALAMGVPPQLARGMVRFSLGDESNEEDIDIILTALKAAIERIRRF